MNVFYLLSILLIQVRWISCIECFACRDCEGTIAGANYPEVRLCRGKACYTSYDWGIVTRGCTNQGSDEERMMLRSKIEQELNLTDIDPEVVNMAHLQEICDTEMCNYRSLDTIRDSPSSNLNLTPPKWFGLITLFLMFCVN